MPKKTYPENIQKLKEQLETGNNLVDYFFVCGVEPTICQNQDLYNISDDNYLENINKTIKPSILCKFPEFDNNNDTIDESIISYCFPNGFEIIHSASSDPKRKIFSIILDNNLFSSEYPQKYLTCILFYEKLSQYKKLQQQMEKIEKNKDNDFIDLDETLISSIRSSLKDEKNVNIHRHNKILTSILPSINIDDHVIEDPNMGKLEIGNMRNTLNQPIFKLKYYYIPKCICLVSIHPYIKLYQKILSNIYSYGCSVNNEIPIEKIITNLIIEVPIPPRGLYSINYNYNFNFNEKSSNTNSNSNTSVSRAQSVAFVLTSQSQVQVVQPLQSTENNKLLISEIDLKRFNRNLSFICKLETIKHILLGSKILFFSLNVNTLTDTILSFLNLVFPFKYPFQVTSFLHKNNYNILESISPFIMGICEEYSENFFEKNDITLEGMNVFIVDLDKQDGQKNYHLFSDEEFPDFPSKLVSNLEKEIKSLESNTIQNNDNINKEKIIKEFNEQYQEKFFHFFCEILKGYEEYLNMDFFKSDTDNVTSIETLFNCDQFIKSSYHYQSDFPFYTKILYIKE